MTLDGSVRQILHERDGLAANVRQLEREIAQLHAIMELEAKHLAEAKRERDHFMRLYTKLLTEVSSAMSILGEAYKEQV